MRRILFTGIFLLAIVLIQTPAFSQIFIQLKDINSGHDGSDPAYPVVLNDVLYFVADDGVHGDELWKTDGTNAGTVMVKDIYPQINASFPSYLTVMNGFIYFRADNGYTGPELWKTDGTAAGTTLVKDIVTGIKNGSAPTGLVVIGNTLFFAATTSAGTELWKTDGTNAGTVMVKDINPGANDSDPTSLTNLNGLLVFAAADGFPVDGPNRHGNEIWKSDGTAAGTVMLKDIHNINTVNFSCSSNPTQFFNYDGTLYFKARSIYAQDVELYKSDGTTAGTVLVKDIYPGHYNPDFTPGYGRSGDPRYFTKMSGSLYFSANNGANGNEIWKSDGTEVGTVMIKDIYTGGTVANNPPVPEWGFVGFSSNPKDLCAWSGDVYFSAIEPTGGNELWKTNGTAAGTTRVRDIFSGAGNGNPANMRVAVKRLYFSANDGANGNELWTTEGRSANTTLVKDFEPGSGSSNPYIFAEANGKIFVVATTSTLGTELWVSKGVIEPPIGGPFGLKGALKNENGELEWNMDNEVSTASYVVERSIDGNNFSPVGNVSAEDANYTDANVKSLGAPVLYYRLRQTNAGSKFIYSNIVALNVDGKKNFATLYPNPVKSAINMFIALDKKEKVKWQLSDNNGRVVKSGFYDLSAGSTAVSIEASGIPSGNYLMQLNGTELNQVIKVIKQ